jgi:DNA repair ATPase RecN
MAGMFGTKNALGNKGGGRLKQGDVQFLLDLFDGTVQEEQLKELETIWEQTEPNISKMKNQIKQVYMEMEFLKEEIRKVTAEQIQSMAKTIFVDKYLNLALVGPFKNETNFIKTLRF